MYCRGHLRLRSRTLVCVTIKVSFCILMSVLHPISDICRKTVTSLQSNTCCKVFIGKPKTLRYIV